MSKTKKITIFSLLGAFAIVLVLGSIFDLSISKALADLTAGEYYSQNGFAIFFEAFGELIMFLLVSTAIGILFFYVLKKPFKNKALNITSLIVLPLAGLASTVYGVKNTLDSLTRYVSFSLQEFLDSMLGKVAYVFLSIAICALIFLLLTKLNDETIKKLLKWAIVVVVTCVTATLIVKGLKIIVGRTRFRAMVYEGDTAFEHYSPWFAINNSKMASVFEGAGDYFKSFPSGHASAVASVFLLTLLPQYLGCGKKTTIWLYAGATTLTLVVLLSRIIAGAHFFTDVYLGACITVFLTYIVNWATNKIAKKMQAKQYAKDDIESNEQEAEIKAEEKIEEKAEARAEAKE